MNSISGGFTFLTALARTGLRPSLIAGDGYLELSTTLPNAAMSRSAMFSELVGSNFDPTS